MKFTVNRKILHEYLKSMVKVVPKNSPMSELGGFLIECGEDDGFLYSASAFLDLFNTIKGEAVIEVSSKGLLLVSDHTSKYVLINRIAPAIQKPNKKQAKEAA